MKKVLSTLSAAIITATAFARDSSGSRMDYEANPMTIPTPLLLLGLLIATINCFWMGNFKTRMAEEMRPEWYG